MFAQVGEQVLLAAELVGQLVRTEGCPVISPDSIGAAVYCHLGVLHHGCELCWNLLMILFIRIKASFKQLIKAERA